MIVEGFRDSLACPSRNSTQHNGPLHVVNVNTQNYGMYVPVKILSKNKTSRNSNVYLS